MGSNFIIKGNICQTPTSQKLDLHKNAYIVCTEGVSRGIFESVPEKYKNLEIIDYKDCLVFPGMVDLHIHAPQYSFIGMSMDLELLEWLKKYTFPEEEKYMDLNYAEKAYRIFVDSIKKSATTRACVFATIHRHATQLLMSLMENSGLISFVGKVNMDQGGTSEIFEKSAELSASETVNWINYATKEFTRTKPILTPRFVPSCSNGLMKEIGKIQAGYGIPVQSHLSENRKEVEYVKSLHPSNAFYGDVYDEYGLFGKNNLADQPFNTVMAHCVWSADEEVELMKQNGVFIAHCPASNMNLTSGIAPIRKYLDMGINVAIGTDVAAGDSISVFRAITDTIKASKMYFRLINDAYKPILFSEAFYIATKGGGKFFGSVGSFENGYEFDAVILDDSILPSPRELTLRERVERAVYLGLDEKGIIAKYVRGQKIDI